MPLEKQLRTLHDGKVHEVILVEVPKSRLRRPFPLWWGLASLALFLAFAVVAQLQFNRLNDERLYRARLDGYETALKGYESAVQAHNDCVDGLGRSAGLRNILGGVSALFELTASLPVELLPNSEEARIYREKLLLGIQQLITVPLDKDLPPRTEADCPPMPDKKPEKPER